MYLALVGNQVCLSIALELSVNRTVSIGASYHVQTARIICLVSGVTFWIRTFAVESAREFK